jgi:hypothetical protein
MALPSTEELLLVLKNLAEGQQQLKNEMEALKMRREAEAEEEEMHHAPEPSWDYLEEAPLEPSSEEAIVIKKMMGKDMTESQVELLLLEAPKYALRPVPPLTRSSGYIQDKDLHRLETKISSALEFLVAVWDPQSADQAQVQHEALQASVSVAGLLVSVGNDIRDQRRKFLVKNKSNILTQPVRTGASLLSLEEEERFKGSKATARPNFQSGYSFRGAPFRPNFRNSRSNSTHSTHSARTHSAHSGSGKGKGKGGGWKKGKGGGKGKGKGNGKGREASGGEQN